MNNITLATPLNISSSQNRKGIAQNILLALLIIFCVKNAHAAKECYFSGAPLTTTLTLSGPEINMHPHVNSIIMLTNNDLKATSSSGIHSDCRTGNDGENLYGKKGTIAQAGSFDPYKGYSAVLYATNIPGILYSVKLRRQTNASVVAYIPINTDMITLYNMHDDESTVENRYWDFYIDLYQTSQFVGIPKGVSAIHPLTQGNAGSFRLGGADSNNGVISVNIGDFSFPVKAPTCTSLVSSAGNIPLGDYTAAKIRAGSTSVVNFTLNASGCTNVSMFKTRMTTVNVAPGNSALLGNSATSNAATGVGVKITTAAGGQLIPNDTNSINSVSDTNIPASKQLQFSAQLVADSKTISVGSFSAKGTFVVNYE
ncbi:fimbrial protein [Rahnella aquatilis]|uniref:fimbrial protein n=1 Tax=Rahnella aquatilis TaxID=34038 RepID=UPI000645A124|nr:fimbrial protein [Rahnella aquatilis]